MKLTDKTVRDYPVYTLSMNKFKELTPDYHLYDDGKADALMKKYPEFYGMWKQVRFPIMKVDILRFVILYHFGGLVADLDVIPLVRSLQTEIDPGSIFIFTPEKINYEVLVSEKGNEFWLDFLRYVKTQIAEKSKMDVYNVWKGRYVLNTTGPAAFRRFLKLTKNPNVVLIPMNRFCEQDTIDDTVEAIKSKKYPFITLQQSGWLESLGVKDHYKKDATRDKIMALLTKP